MSGGIKHPPLGGFNVGQQRPTMTGFPMGQQRPQTLGFPTQQVRPTMTGIPTRQVKPTQTEYPNFGGVTGSVVKSEPIEQQAKKYKSAEEFVEAQEIFYHGSQKDFKSEDIDFNKGNLREGAYLSSNLDVAKTYGKNIHEYTIDPKSKTLDLSDGESTLDFILKEDILEKADIDVDLENYILSGRIFQYDPYNRQGIVDNIMVAAKSKGYDVVKLFDDLGVEDNIATIVVNKDVIKTKQQLTDIYNKAKGQDPLIEEAKKYERVEEFVGSKKVVFHGTNKEFEEFKIAGEVSPYKRESVGPHFGTKEQAGFVAKTKGGKVKEFYLDIKNPIRLEDRNSWSQAGINNQLFEKGIITRAEYDDNVYKKETYDTRKILREKGYDGIVYSNTAEGKGDSYIAFSNEQIKTKQQLTDIYNKAKGRSKSHYDTTWHK